MRLIRFLGSPYFSLLWVSCIPIHLLIFLFQGSKNIRSFALGGRAEATVSNNKGKRKKGSVYAGYTEPGIVRRKQ